MKTLIKGGTVITAADTFPADILVDGEKIALMGADLPSESLLPVTLVGHLPTEREIKHREDDGGIVKSEPPEDIRFRSCE